MNHCPNGSPEVLERLKQATDDNCECGEGKPTCPAHKLLVDQTVLDHMAFIAYLTPRLVLEEFEQHAA